MLTIASPQTSIESPSAPVPSSPDSLSTDRSPASPYRVLLVDDDEKTHRLLRDILESYPDITIVGEAFDGQEAVTMAATQQPDVILMDIVMPHLDGVEATLQIKKTRPRTVVIGIAGHFATRTYNAMRTAGASAFLCKNQVLGVHDTILFALGH